MTKRHLKGPNGGTCPNIVILETTQVFLVNLTFKFCCLKSIVPILHKHNRVVSYVKVVNLQKLTQTFSQVCEWNDLSIDRISEVT